MRLDLKLVDQWNVEEKPNLKFQIFGPNQRILMLKSMSSKRNEPKEVPNKSNVCIYI